MAVKWRGGRQPKDGRPRAEVAKKVMYFVYIIKSLKTGKLYKGYTQDLKNRIREHNSGTVASTKSGVSWRLIYYEVFLNKTDALREELFLKSGKGKERIKYLLEKTLRK